MGRSTAQNPEQGDAPDNNQTATTEDDDKMNDDEETEKAKDSQNMDDEDTKQEKDNENTNDDDAAENGKDNAENAYKEPSDKKDANQQQPQEQQQQQSATFPSMYSAPYYGGYYPYPVPGLFQPSQQQPQQYTDAAGMADPAPEDVRRNRGGVAEPFPEKLHKMLDVCEQEGNADIVSFFPHGRAFAIHKPRRFAEEIMPRFFRQTKLTSFQRQLNLYGFKRITSGPDNGGYYHELFLKNRLGLCHNMKRTKIKGPDKEKPDPDSEPNFYLYPPLEDGPTTDKTRDVLRLAQGPRKQPPPLAGAPPPYYMSYQLPPPYGPYPPYGAYPPFGYPPYGYPYAPQVYSPPPQTQALPETSPVVKEQKSGKKEEQSKEGDKPPAAKGKPATAESRRGRGRLRGSGGEITM